MIEADGQPRGVEARLRSEMPVIGATDQEMRLLFMPSLEGAARSKDTFNGLESFCVFIGYPRSGHSLIGSILDAHPEMIVAHELDAFKFVEAGFNAGQLYYLLLENSRLCARFGRIWGRYSYAVAGQWQGTFSRLRIIGDKKGGLTTSRIARNPHVLDTFLRAIPLSPRFVHVVRNPYDNVATMATRHALDLETAVDQYLLMCRTNESVQHKVGLDQVLDLRHEDFLARPHAELQRLCDFLGVTAAPDYLDACAAIVNPDVHRTRRVIDWPQSVRSRLEREIARFDFLSGYSFEE